MNYNANTGGKQAFGRKIKRVSDVNAMGYNPYEQGNAQQNLYPNLEPNLSNPNAFQQDFSSNQQQSFNQQGFGTPKAQAPPGFQYNGQQPQYAARPAPNQPQKLDVFGQPVIQEMAFQYGQQLAGAGKDIIKQEVERYVPVTKLKYYFAVDTKYVMSKLLLLFFPFTHKDWSIKYEQDGPVQPRFEINAPDLYIPTMAYVTYVLIAGLVLGMQERFTPEQLGILASSALAWCIVELVIYSCTLYIIQVETSLRTLDLLAYSGYKYVGTIFSIVVYIITGKLGYYSGLMYINFALAFFLVRSLKAQVLAETNTQQTSYYGEQPVAGSKRRLYFLLFVAAIQPLLSWWLSFHLLGSPKVTPPAQDFVN